MSRRKLSFNIMLAGSTGSGKSSFINTLFKKKMVEVNKKEFGRDIDVFVMDVDCEGIKKRMNVVDTPGFGSTMDDSILHDSIIAYIKSQYDVYLAEETKIRRNVRCEDTRIHVLLYFILPRRNGLRPTDIVFLKKVSNLVNVIPLISKADFLTPEESKNIKEKIKRQLIENEINTFSFNTDLVPNSLELNEYKPFSIISNEWIRGDVEVGRKYYYGSVDVENPAHCDFLVLKELLFTSYTDLLIDQTNNELYEDYRAEVLANILPSR
ncbi:Septin [Spraguea lophii 42_110]|uniref:Septin n=1 Tax=Spraguea lophii (strain 42_110) TaxID=1358809 RepID=S7XL82_SPRLO|nr:Septin [Spraguea lophii 42_110]